MQDTPIKLNSSGYFLSMFVPRNNCASRLLFGNPALGGRRRAERGRGHGPAVFIRARVSGSWVGARGGRAAQAAPRRRAGPHPGCCALSQRSRLRSSSSLRCASSCACGRAGGGGRREALPRSRTRLPCAPPDPHLASPPTARRALAAAPWLTRCLGRTARGAGTCPGAARARRSAAFSWIRRCSSSTRSSWEGAPAAAHRAFFSSHLGGRRGRLRRASPRWTREV